MAGDERDARRPRDLARAWTRALEHVTRPEQRLRAILSLAAPLAGARRALVFGEDGVLAAAPGAADGLVMRRLFDRARRVLEDELVTPELYVARIAPERPERVALRWRAPDAASLEAARAIVVSCAWALEHGVATAHPPADLPDSAETLHRLEQLVHDARRMRRAFAVVYVEVETSGAAADGFARDALARRLRGAVRANDHVGHLGGDAFLVLVALAAGESEAYPAAERLLRAAAGASADATANVGVAICPEDGLIPHDLVEKASAAALAAASVGGTQPYWYREQAGRTLRRRSLVRTRLSDGDPGALFDLAYEPIFDARSGAPCAVAAAARWRTRCELGGTDPFDDLAGAPDRGARHALQRWTIAGAADAYRMWWAAGLDLRVDLALAADDDALVDAIADAFGAGDAMRRVSIEIVGADEAAPAPSRCSPAGCARLARAWALTPGARRARRSTPSTRASWTSSRSATTRARGLAALALASMLAPAVIAGAVGDPSGCAGSRATARRRPGARDSRTHGFARAGSVGT